MKKPSISKDTSTPTKELYGYFESAYDHFNQALFDGQLPSCILTVQRKTKAVGYAAHKRWSNVEMRLVDELAVNPDYWLLHPELEVLQTLVHEQCHIWQSYFGTPGRRSYHNKEWADKMESIGLMPSSTGAPGGRRTGECMADYAIVGGMFFAACTEFVAAERRLPWVDRHAPRHELCPARLYSASGRVVVTTDLSETQRSLLQAVGPLRKAARSSEKVVCLGLASSQLNGAVEVTAELADLLESASSAHGEGQVTDNAVLEQVFQVAAKKPTRVKYVCRKCSNQLWGKPSMNILCGDCEVAFEQQGE